MEAKRNRSEGWKAAKLTGHLNEQLLKEMMETDENTINYFLSKVGKEDSGIKSVKVGGLNEKDVPCVFDNEKTKSKTDMSVILTDGSKYNISIKKSNSGQVYLIKPNRFIEGFEHQYNTKIPKNIVWDMYLFWGYEEIEDIIKEFGTHKSYELRKRRIVAETLKKYDLNAYNDLLEWFKQNIKNVTDFCFSKGLAKNREDWADLIWYINELGETNTNNIYFIKDLKDKVEEYAYQINYGNKNGGTTIQLPFGFVQWHCPEKILPGSMQFHHKYINIKNIMEK